MSAALKMAARNTHDIVDTVQNSGSYTKLLTALKAAGLLETLRGAGPFTVFAPSDEAFKKLPVGAFEGLLKPESKDELVRILKYHAIAGRVTLGELDCKKCNRKSVEGATLLLDGTVGVRVNRATVTGSEIEASNGVIHAIDSVLVPPKARQETAPLARSSSGPDKVDASAVQRF
jgi:uncharacterized surface protein with fasciclin (FAS1) repeats